MCKHLINNNIMSKTLAYVNYFSYLCIVKQRYEGRRIDKKNIAYATVAGAGRKTGRCNRSFV